jgi:hypothetical protein
MIPLEMGRRDESQESHEYRNTILQTITVNTKKQKKTEEANFYSLLKQLASKEGLESVKTIISLINENKKIATEKHAELTKQNIEKDAELTKQSTELTQNNRRLLLILQVVVFAIAVGVIAFLSWKGKLDPSIAILIGTLVGYFFGRRSS